MQISFSTLKSFVDCEAEALAYKQGKWDRSKTFSDTAKKAMHNGTLVHTFFQSDEDFERLLTEQQDIYLTKGQFRKVYYEGLDMIDKLNSSKLFHSLYQGSKEPEIKGNIAGMNYHGFIDCLNDEQKLFCDIKTIRGSLAQKTWNEKTRQKEHWIINRKYHWQMAIYQELLRQNGKPDYTPIICAVSKEQYNDIEVIEIPQDILDEALEEVKEHTRRFVDVFLWEESPVHCGNCNYCKSIKTAERIKSLKELM